MIFSKKNAGKWVASKDNKIIATSTKLESLVKKVESRKDKSQITFDRVPLHNHFAGICAISLY
jgi:hypothetical protein